MLNYSNSTIAVVLAIGFCSQVNVMAGLDSRTGKEVDFWPKHSVVYAEISKVERLPSNKYSHGTHRLWVRPIATLSGSFDPGLHPELELGIWISGFDSTITQVPTEAKHAVIVIWKHEKDYLVTPSGIGFMPKGSGLVEVDGFSDPVVKKILSDVQKVRKNQNSN